MSSQSGRTYVKTVLNCLQPRNDAATETGSPKLRYGPYHPPPKSVSAIQRGLEAVRAIPSFFFQSKGPGSSLVITAHHIFYLLAAMAEHKIISRPPQIRMESINASNSAEYVSFFSDTSRASDSMSLRSTSSSIRTLRGVTAFFTSWINSFRDNKAEKAFEREVRDLKEISKLLQDLPSLEVVADSGELLIDGFESYPLETAVPIHFFFNLEHLSVDKVNVRYLLGWDMVASQIQSLSVTDGDIADLAVLTFELVFDDANLIRSLSPKKSGTYIPPLDIPTIAAALDMPSLGLFYSPFASADPSVESAGEEEGSQRGSTVSVRSPSFVSSPFFTSRSSMSHQRQSSTQSSPFARPTSAIMASPIGSTPTSRRQPSTSRLSSMYTNSGQNVDKWDKLTELRVSNNGFTDISVLGILPVARNLRSLNASHNPFKSPPLSIHLASNLSVLDLSYCQIGTLTGWQSCPPVSVSHLNLRGNLLRDLTGIECLSSLVYVDLSGNQLSSLESLTPLTELENLEEIQLWGNPLTKTIPLYSDLVNKMFQLREGGERVLKMESRKKFADQALKAYSHPAERMTANNSRVDVTPSHSPLAAKFPHSVPPHAFAHLQLAFEGVRRMDHKRTRSELPKHTSSSRNRPMVNSRLENRAKTYHSTPTGPVDTGARSMRNRSTFPTSVSDRTHLEKAATPLPEEEFMSSSLPASAFEGYAAAPPETDDDTVLAGSDDKQFGLAPLFQPDPTDAIGSQMHTLEISQRVTDTPLTTDSYFHPIQTGRAEPVEDSANVSIADSATESESDDGRRQPSASFGLTEYMTKPQTFATSAVLT